MTYRIYTFFSQANTLKWRGKTDCDQTNIIALSNSLKENYQRLIDLNIQIPPLDFNDSIVNIKKIVRPYFKSNVSTKSWANDEIMHEFMCFIIAKYQDSKIIQTLYSCYTPEASLVEPQFGVLH